MYIRMCVHSVEVQAYLPVHTCLCMCACVCVCARVCAHACVCVTDVCVVSQRSDWYGNG